VETRGVLFFKPYPFYVKRAKGSRIWDVDGNEIIDYCFNYCALILGHNHPRVANAIREQLEYGPSLGAPTEREVDLAERITKRMPSIEMMRFTVTGSEAVMNACRLARAYTGRDKVAKFEGAMQVPMSLSTSTSIPTKGPLALITGLRASQTQRAPPEVSWRIL
jgi:glutamate-1-semialdehyde 2,1-aminomutase